jgi:YVTN family beta-propeller protein
VTTIPIPVRGPVSLVAGVGGQVWVAGQGDNGSFAARGESHRPSLVPIDPDSSRVARRPVELHYGADAVAIANSEATLWVALTAPEAPPLRSFDPGSGRRIASVTGAPDAGAVAIGPDSVWAVDLGARGSRGRVLELTPTDAGRFAAAVPVGRAPAGVAIDRHGIWVTNELDDNLMKIDPRSRRRVATIRVGDGPVGVTAAAGSIWVANGGDGTVSRIDPRANRRAATIQVGRRPRDVAGGGRSLWVTNELDDSVSRVDPKTNDVEDTIPVGAGPAGIAYGEGAVWVANSLDQTVSRIEP